MKFKIVLLLSIVLLVLTGVVLQAQVSDNYDLSWHVLATGGREGMASGSHTVHGTLGQLAIGPATSGVTSVGSGYWPGVRGSAGSPVSVSHRIYLPIVLR